jgi:hypothetical protein
MIVEKCRLLDRETGVRQDLPDARSSAVAHGKEERLKGPFPGFLRPGVRLIDGLQ